MEKYSITNGINTVTITELSPDHPARMYEMAYNASLTTCGYSCGIGHFCKTIEEAKEFAARYVHNHTEEEM